jgi:hypothetical protein
LISEHKLFPCPQATDLGQFVIEFEQELEGQRMLFGALHTGIGLHSRSVETHLPSGQTNCPGFEHVIIEGQSF